MCNASNEKSSIVLDKNANNIFEMAKKDRFLKNRVSRAGVAGKDQWMKKLTWKNLNQVNLTLALTSTLIRAAI